MKANCTSVWFPPKYFCFKVRLPLSLTAMGTQITNIWVNGKVTLEPKRSQRTSSTYLAHYVLPIDECFKTTHGCLIIQRKNVFCLNGHMTLICVRLKNNNLKKKNIPLTQRYHIWNNIFFALLGTPKVNDFR